MYSPPSFLFPLPPALPLESTLSLLLSEFSHTEIWHIALNMVVFWSFAPALLCRYNNIHVKEIFCNIVLNLAVVNRFTVVLADHMFTSLQYS